MINTTSRRVKPNFLCIGAQKAGTTWLDRNLRAHPDVWLPPVKEIHYFDQVYIGEPFIEKERLKKLHSAIGRKLSENEKIGYRYLNFLSNFALTQNKNDDWYISLFQNATHQKAIGDITPAYSALPDDGIKHIKKLLGEPKIIFMMRNPVKRMWSGALMAKRNEIANGKEVSVDEWLQLLQSERALVRGDYKRTIESYEKFFSKDSFLYLFYDQVCLEPNKLLKEVCDFLEIEFSEEIFQDRVGSVYNANPKVMIPPPVKAFLDDKYRPLNDWILDRFKPDSLEF